MHMKPNKYERKTPLGLKIMKSPTPQTSGNSSSLEHPRTPGLPSDSFPPAPRLLGNKM
jgi:hypothetical protein